MQRRLVAPATRGGPLNENTPDLIGDAVDVRGTTPAGDRLVVDTDLEGGVTLLFLTTTCGISLSIGRALGADPIRTQVQHRWVVVLRENDDPHLTANDLLGTSDVTVLLSDEAFDDYEVPASPYAVVIGGRPASVITEGPVGSFRDALLMSGRSG